MNKLSFIRITAVAAVVAASVAGCTSQSTHQANPGASDQPLLIKVTLSYQPSGTVALRWDRQSEYITANLQMGGFTPGSTYAVEIHKGACNAIGEVAVPFPEVTADGAGTVSTTVTGELASPGGLYPGTTLSMHLDGGAEPANHPEPSTAPLACGDITAAVLATTLTMAPLGPRPQGWANLTYNPKNKTLIVATAVNGLAPGSAHAQDIGLGTCQARRAVKYPLSDLVASTHGTAYQTTVIQDVDQTPPALGGWYLNVHSGSSAQVMQDGQPTPYVAPIACGDIGKLASTS